MIEWLIHSNDGAHRGPVSSVDLARALRAGMLLPDQLVTRAHEARRDWKALSGVHEIQVALADLGDAAPVDDPLLRTRVATPAAINALEGDSGPTSRDEMRRIAPPPRRDAPGSGPDAAPASAPPSDQIDRTLVAPSPFDDEPYDDDVPTTVDSQRPPSPAAPVARKRPSIPDWVPEPAIREMPIAPGPPPRAEGTTAGVARAVAPPPGPRHRVYVALAFAGGLVGGLLVIVIALMIFGD